MIKDSEANLKRRHAKKSEADKTKRRVSEIRGVEVRAGVVAMPGKDLLHVRLYHKFCNIPGSKVFPLIWKARKCPT